MVERLIAGLYAALQAALIAALLALSASVFLQIIAPRQLEVAACGFRPPQAGACDGWRALYPKLATIAWISVNDPEFADSLLGHNEQGKAICGWRPAQRNQ